MCSLLQGSFEWYVVWYVPVLYSEKQQEEYIVKKGRTADLGRIVPVWTFVYCDWDNQVHKKTTHLHERRKMCLYSNNCTLFCSTKDGNL